MMEKKKLVSKKAKVLRKTEQATLVQFSLNGVSKGRWFPYASATVTEDGWLYVEDWILNKFGLEELDG